MDDLRNMLLCLLREDPAIRSEIKSILTDEPNTEPPEEAVPVTDAAAALEQRVEQLHQQCRQLQDVLASYARLESVYGSYLELPETVRNQCGMAVNDFSPLAFAVTGAEEGTLRFLHELICREWESYSDRTLSILNACFDLFFDLFLIGHPQFGRLLTHEGDSFDPARHMLTRDSAPGGRITKVIISGFTSGEMPVRSLVSIQNKIEIVK